MATPKKPIGIKVYLGTSEAKRITFKVNGAVFDVSGYTGAWEFIAKNDADDADGDAVLTITGTPATPTGNITWVTNGTDGKIRIQFSSAGLPAKGRYPCFIRAALGTGDKEMLAEGVLIVVPGGAS